MEAKLRVSRIGRTPVVIPADVKVGINGQVVAVEGKLGKLQIDVRPEVSVEQADGKVLVKVAGDNKLVRSLHGLTRALINNMVTGVSIGFEKSLTLIGVGYRASVIGKKIKLEVGKSHEVLLDIPEGITAEVSKKQDNIILKGCDKCHVGQFAAVIMKERPVEPYKGKGIRITGTHVKLKAGKKAGKK
ncbi:MAG: 50S ribosomal protein L6 [Candidatus Cloacimonadota bacterium]|nr:MAG: 50S ribosomal protein L6 [Candidatus Cloacimonadota bacterium]